jgi:hypothetical protein
VRAERLFCAVAVLSYGTASFCSREGGARFFGLAAVACQWPVAAAA